MAPKRLRADRHMAQRTIRAGAIGMNSLTSSKDCSLACGAYAMRCAFSFLWWTASVLRLRRETVRPPLEKRTLGRRPNGAIAVYDRPKGFSFPSSRRWH